MNTRQKIISILNSYDALNERDPIAAERFIEEIKDELTKDEIRMLDHQLALMVV